MSTTAKGSIEEKKLSQPHPTNPAHGETAHGFSGDAAAARKAAWALYLIVFFSGAVLMGIEIAGARILAPGFGTSTFVWGSIIGLFMGALAAGYYWGGYLADEWRWGFNHLVVLVAGAAIWTVLFIPYLGLPIADAIAQANLGIRLGPFVAATALFGIPTLLAGTVSPLSVKLNTRSLSGVGGAAGGLYALSTLGSIVGTLATTFVLIPYMSVYGVITALGITLLIVCAVSFFLFHTASKTMGLSQRSGLASLILLIVFFGECAVIFPNHAFVQPDVRVIHEEDSSYHQILVTEDVMYTMKDGNGGLLYPPKVWDRGGVRDVARWLKFNDNTESGIYPYRSDYANAVSYTDLLHLPVIWQHDPLPKKILVVGGGGGIVPVQYRQWYKTEVDIAEIDPVVKRVALDYFRVPDEAKTPGIHYIIGDGRQTVKNAKDGTYDVIVLDAYSSGGQIPFHLMTWEFLNECKKKLTPRGILITNIISGLKNVPAGTNPADLFLAEYKTLTQAPDASMVAHAGVAAAPLFKATQVRVFPKVYEGDPLVGDAFGRYRNVIVMATQEENPMDAETMLSEAQRLTDAPNPVVKGPNLVWIVKQLYGNPASTSGRKPTDDELKSVPVLTDNYAPVDLMYRPVRIDENQRPLW